MRLLKPSDAHENDVMTYRKIFLESNDNLAGGSYLSNYESYHDWLMFIRNNESEETRQTEVTASVFLAYDEDVMVGIINIRHQLNEYLFNYGGHIGYSVLPAKRKMGYGKVILEEGIKQCHQLGIKEILVTCNSRNIGSKKIIESQGGILENIVEQQDDQVMRFWIRS